MTQELDWKPCCNPFEYLQRTKGYVLTAFSNQSVDMPGGVLPSYFEVKIKMKRMMPLAQMFSEV